MRVAILGYGKQGRSAYEYWNSKPGNEVVVCDSREDLNLPDTIKRRIGPGYLQGLDQFDIVVRSAPSIHPREIVSANSKEILSRVTSNTNEFLRVCPTENIIGITGTKGKGTTSTLITKLLEANGKTVHLGGNIGTPPLDLLDRKIQPNDWVVLELANFQLIDLDSSPHIAACLMVVPEHLDWHADMEEYIKAKQQLFKHQSDDDIAIYYANNENSKKVIAVSRGNKIPYYKKPGAVIENSSVQIDNKTICKTDELKLVGLHNWQNVCAAVTIMWQIDQNIETMRSVLLSFKGLEHRIELVRKVGGVSYFNDSYASVPDAAIAAMEAITTPKIMIVGGFERGIPLINFAIEIKNHTTDLKKVVIVGASGPRLAKELDKAEFRNYVIEPSKDINEIVNRAQAFASPGDSVVLSPGFASFDMFENFEDRGQQYKAAVNKL